MSTLKPCPFCDGTNTEIRASSYWTGMRSVVSHYELIHWCDKQPDEFLTNTIKARGRTEEQLTEFWNG